MVHISLKSINKGMSTNLNIFLHTFQVTPSASNSTTCPYACYKYVNITQCVFPYFWACGLKVDL
jgi:hypothetical protein